MRKSPSARLLVAVAACAATMATLASCSAASPRQTGRPGAAPPAPTAPARLSLPAPAGRNQVGTVSLHLIDRSRRNPFAAAPPYRELMVSIWYPAREAARYPLAPYMLPGAAAHFGSPAGQGQQLLNVPPGKVDWSAIRTSGHQEAPLARHGAPFPVVLYSPDVQDPRTLGTTAVQDLASRGYVVVTIDPTYDASEVEFPGSRVVNGQLPQLMKLPQRHKKQELKPLQQRVLAKAAVSCKPRVVAVGRPWRHVLVAILDATATGTWQGAS